MGVLSKRKRGSLLLVLVYGTIMAVVMVNFVQLSQSLSTSSKDSAKVYQDIQDYRAAAELACYSYVTALESVTVTKDLESDWLTVDGAAIMTQALQAIQGEFADPEDSSLWVQHDVTQAITAMSITNPAVLTNLLGKFVDVKHNLDLKIPEPLRLSRDHIVDFDVEVTLEVKGEMVIEYFKVGNLYLSVEETKNDEGNKIVIMNITEGPEGVNIYREP